MSLITPALPPAVLRAFNTGLGDFVSPMDPLWQVMLKKFFALQAFTLDLDKFQAAIKDGKAVPPSFGSDSDADRLVAATGWRFLASDGDSYGGCHVGSFDPQLPPKLTCFTREVEVLTAAEKYQDLNNLDELRTCTFEPRVLRLSWARLEVFWLHLPDGMAQPNTCDGNDMVVPYIGFVESPPKYINPTTRLELGDAYTVSDFLTAIQNYINTPVFPSPGAAGLPAQAPLAGHFVPKVRRP